MTAHSAVAPGPVPATGTVNAFWWRPLTGRLPQRVLDVRSFRPRLGTPSVLQTSWRLRNFGDELTPYLVSRVGGRPARHRDVPRADLVVVGSVLQRALREARAGSVVAGSGLHAPEGADAGDVGRLDVRLVRGHLTREALRLPARTPVGDPGLALRLLVPQAQPQHGARPLLVLHFGLVRRSGWRATLDGLRRSLDCDVVFTWDPVERVLDAVAASSVVVSTSLHGVVVADALGVPALPAVLGAARRDFRFDDYHSALGMPPEPLVPLAGMDPSSLAAQAGHRFRALGGSVLERAEAVATALRDACQASA